MFAKIQERYYQVFGRADEREEQESNRIYKWGMWALMAGFVVDMYYRIEKAQVQWVSGNAGATYQPTLLDVWFIVVMIAVSIAASRKGLLGSTKLSETEEFPVGLYALISGGVGLGAGLLAAIMRIVAEVQVVGWEGVMWLGDFAIMLVLGGSVFALCMFAFYASFRTTKRFRDKMEEESD